MEPCRTIARALGRRTRGLGGIAPRIAVSIAAAIGVAACGEDSPRGPRTTGPVDFEDEETLARAEASPGGVGPSAEELERLAAMPYLEGYEPAPETTGVVVHDAARCEEGLNLVLSGHAAQARLIDMDGAEVHRWALPVAALWPERAARGEGTHWRRAALFPDGDLLAIYEGVGIVRLDRDGVPRWSYEGNCHHDLFVEPDGRIHVLARRAQLVPAVNPSEPVLEDLVAVLSPEGELLGETSVLGALLATPSTAPLIRRSTRKGDVLHTNTVQLLDASLAAFVPGATAGDYLVSSPFLDTIGVIHPATGRFVWSFTGTEGGRFRMQHDPVLLSDGHILLFDNLGDPDGSKVIELDPKDGSVGWTFRSTATRPFSSIRLGANQRLPNGNTLITESLRGAALEVTRDGAVVWEFRNPHTSGEGAAMLEQFLAMSERAKELWNPEHVAEVRAQLEAARSGTLSATLLDVVRYPQAEIASFTFLGAREGRRTSHEH